MTRRIIDSAATVPVAGVEDARLGLSSFLRPGAWRDQAAEYRAFLFGAAGRSTHSSKRTLNQEAIEKVGREGGELSLPELLRLKVRYFTDGVVLGSAIGLRLGLLGDGLGIRMRPCHENDRCFPAPVCSSS